MTGAACGTGMPASNRMSVSGISPNSLPEQFCHSNMGGFFSGMLKFAGYDGLIVEGKAPVHTYVYIDEDNVEFLPADGFIWGDFVHETQDKIFEKHGKNSHAVVIGPAGEHLHRNASITNSNDSAAAKAGFGAVMGSKNLKAIVVHGNREVPVADPMRVMELHKSVGYPVKAPNPMTRRTVYGGAKMTVDVPEGFDNARLCCGFGCNVVCMNTIFDAPNPVDGPEKVAQVIKCVDIAACNMTYDVVRGDWNNIHSRRNENPRGETYDQMCANTSFRDAPLPPFQGSYQYNKLRVNDPNNPELPEILTCYTGDKLNYFGPSFARGTTISVLCTQYGLDKWDVIVWYFSWLAMAQQEGLLDDLDFGMKVDVDNVEFVKHFMHMMVYREGKLGNIFAEGMARAMRILGKEKYGDAIYHNRYDMEGKKDRKSVV